MAAKDLIMQVLKEQGELSVWELTDRAGLSYETIKLYTRQMAKSGVLTREARGKHSAFYYSIKIQQ